MKSDGPKSLKLSLARVREQKLIAAMLSCRTLDEAAKVSGINRRTLYRARQDAGFMAKYKAAADELLESTINQLRSNAAEAASMLRQIATDTQQPGNSRVRAAEVTLTTLLKAVETEDILRRIAALEKATEGGRK
ncbi:MAG: helix-turn-helix domain-containing protein [Bryobacteraceae bacterium]